MVQMYPAKAFFKVISENQKIKEIDYIKVDDEGNFYLERQLSNGIIEKRRLVEDVHELC